MQPLLSFHYTDVKSLGVPPHKDTVIRSWCWLTEKSCLVSRTVERCRTSWGVRGCAPGHEEHWWEDPFPVPWAWVTSVCTPLALPGPLTVLGALGFGLSSTSQQVSSPPPVSLTHHWDISQWHGTWVSPKGELKHASNRWCAPIWREFCNINSSNGIKGGSITFHLSEVIWLSATWLKFNFLYLY